MIPYEPKVYRSAPRFLDAPTAWQGVETILYDIIDRFDIKTDCALEFGCDYGFSTVALSGYFKRVIGVDWFKGDPHAGYRDEGQWNAVSNALSLFDNITLIRSSIEDFTANSSGHYDLIHIDIFHEYIPTFSAAIWALDHTDLVMLHDTRSFPPVMAACEAAAKEAGVNFYELPKFHGVGILTRRSPK